MAGTALFSRSLIPGSLLGINSVSLLCAVAIWSHFFPCRWFQDQILQQNMVLMTDTLDCSLYIAILLIKSSDGFVFIERRSGWAKRLNLVIEVWHAAYGLFLQSNFVLQYLTEQKQYP